MNDKSTGDNKKIKKPKAKKIENILLIDEDNFSDEFESYEKITKELA